MAFFAPVTEGVSAVTPTYWDDGTENWTFQLWMLGNDNGDPDKLMKAVASVTFNDVYYEGGADTLYVGLPDYHDGWNWQFYNPDADLDFLEQNKTAIESLGCTQNHE